MNGLRRSLSRVLVAPTLLLALFRGDARAETLLVHLPSVPIESSSRLANAVTALAAYMTAGVPDLDLEVKMFRRWEDAHAFYQANPASVAAILSEPSFLLDLSGDADLLPAWRFSRGGSESYRRVLIVSAENAAVQSLADLRGKNLTFVETTGEQSSAFLERSVFGGEVAPESWFAALEPVTDDFTAVAAVLHGQADAALVADHNPLLRADLGTKLKAVFTSPAQSNPVLALRTSALRGDRRASVDAALSRLADSAEGVRVLSELAVDGLRPIPEADRQALSRLPTPRKKALEIALPAIVLTPTASAAPAPAPAPAPAEVTFSLAIELPETAPVPTQEQQPEP